MELSIPNQRPGKQPDLAQNLEAVARPNHELPLPRLLYHAGHDRRKSGNGAAAEIIAVGKTARQHNRVESVERPVLVPDVFGSDAGNSVQCSQTILVAIRSGKLDHCEFHFTTS